MTVEVEHDLIAPAVLGDTAAFERLVERHSAMTARVARVLLRDVTAAEDAAQDAWVDAWRGLPRFRVGEPLRPWLLTLVINRCRKVVRRRTLATIPLDMAASDSEHMAGDVAEGILRREAAGELRAALAALPADQRRVLELRFFAELDLAAIGVVMECPVGTVKSRLHRGLTALRELMADSDGHSSGVRE